MKHTRVVLMILFSIHFWGYVGISPSIIKMTNIIALGAMIFSMLRQLTSDNMRFKSAIYLLLFGVVCNIISANINNGQGIKDTTLTFFNYYFILIYFYFHDEKLSRKDVEIIIIVFAVLYSIFYLRQEAVFPRRLFAGNMFADRGTIRIRLEGGGFLMLAYLMMINKYLLKRNIFHIILALFFFFILIKGGFRTLTAGAVLISGIAFLKLVKYSPANYLMIVLAVVLFIGMLQMDSTSRIINNMIKTTEEQKEEGENYIRHLQYEYYTKVYPKNFSYYIVGGGLPGAYGPYSAYMNEIVRQFGFYWVDLGLVGFYYVIGLVALLGLLAFTLKAIFIKLPPDYLYLNLFFAYLLIVSITTMEIFRAGMFPVEALALYLIDRGRNVYEGIEVEEDGMDYDELNS